MKEQTTRKSKWIYPLVAVIIGIVAIALVIATSKKSEAALEAKMKQEAAQALQAQIQRQAQEAAEENARQARDRAAAEHKELSDRCGIVQAMGLIMTFKMGPGHRILPVDSANNYLPHSVEELEKMEQGNCRQAIFFSDSDATLIANAFQSEADGAQMTLIKAGFRKVAFIDSTTYCYAAIMPYPIGLGEISCRNR